MKDSVGNNEFSGIFVRWFEDELMNQQRQNQRCSNCKYFDSPSEPVDDYGICRFGPPTFTVEVSEGDHFDDRQPVVRGDKWCGKWKPIILVTTSTEQIEEQSS